MGADGGHGLGLGAGQGRFRVDGLERGRGGAVVVSGGEGAAGDCMRAGFDILNGEGGIALGHVQGEGVCGAAVHLPVKADGTGRGFIGGVNTADIGREGDRGARRDVGRGGVDLEARQAGGGGVVVFLAAGGE